MTTLEIKKIQVALNNFFRREARFGHISDEELEFILTVLGAEIKDALGI